MNRIAAALIIALTPGMGFAGEFPEQQANAYCSAKWGADSAAIEFCMKSQQDGHREFSALEAIGQQDPVMNTALQNCQAKWPGNWSAAVFCANAEFDGMVRLTDIFGSLEVTVAQSLHAHCSAEWPDSYAMQAFCADENK